MKVREAQLKLREDELRVREDRFELRVQEDRLEMRAREDQLELRAKEDRLELRTREERIRQDQLKLQESLLALSTREQRFQTQQAQHRLQQIQAGSGLPQTLAGSLATSGSTSDDHSDGPQNAIETVLPVLKAISEDHQAPLIGPDVTVDQLRARDNARWMAKNGVALHKLLDENESKFDELMRIHIVSVTILTSTKPRMAAFSILAQS
jgi:hypothetical protein